MRCVGSVNHVCVCLKCGPCDVPSVVLTLKKDSWESTTDMRSVGSESRVRVS
jgi:hypothetical protein